MLTNLLTFTTQSQILKTLKMVLKTLREKEKMLLPDCFPTYQRHYRLHMLSIWSSLIFFFRFVKKTTYLSFSRTSFFLRLDSLPFAEQFSKLSNSGGLSSGVRFESLLVLSAQDLWDEDPPERLSLLRLLSWEFADISLFGL